ncbi:hypothetical protein OA84_09220 [Kaistella solincola]|uniref:Uncharacterized protein n=1 Tax=Kaistella solincola TaxID=510955 RepID=A0ABR4ZQP1_9FLAO|nr:hypothetical protein OA84_09220 [Kaistella solincola]
MAEKISRYFSQKMVKMEYKKRSYDSKNYHSVRKKGKSRKYFLMDLTCYFWQNSDFQSLSLAFTLIRKNPCTRVFFFFKSVGAPFLFLK